VSTPVTMPMPGDVAQTRAFLDVGAYVAAVRAQLDDLSRDEIEELTGGLEADLSDALLNQETAPGQMLGSPADYAAELRSAAGLPPRRDPIPGERAGGLPILRLRDLREQALAPLRPRPWWPAVTDFLITLQPAWWLLRAYVAYQLIVESLIGRRAILPYDPITWLALAVLIVGSVELGRRAWAGRGRWQRGLIYAGNAFAVLLILLGVGAFGQIVDSNTGSYSSTEVVVEPPAEGLYNAGHPVVNVFPYDRNGKPLTDVQLFDDRGRPLIGERTYLGPNDQLVRLVPVVTAEGKQGFNVFPLREEIVEPGYDANTGEELPLPPEGRLRPAVLPDATQPPVAPLPAASAKATATPSP
jgi:hypothetical protein